MIKIEVKNLTKDYGCQRGVFGLSFSVEEGEAYGFLGPNGAGKTTTLRHLMGFLKPDSGSVSILGLDCFQDRAYIQSQLGYLPGETALMEEMTGKQFLRFMAKMKGVTDDKTMNRLIDLFELDTRGKIKRMSKGTRQKLGIICAFMASPRILLLDEPTSGLDPLMQNRFIDLVLEEKKRGTTILLSSHIFEEVERTCDRVAFIRQGRLAACRTMDEVRRSQTKIFTLYFASEEEQKLFLERHPQAQVSHHHVNIPVSGDTDSFIKELARYQISDLRVKIPSLEELFLQYYKEEK